VILVNKFSTWTYRLIWARRPVTRRELCMMVGGCLVERGFAVGSLEVP